MYYISYFVFNFLRSENIDAIIIRSVTVHHNSTVTVCDKSSVTTVIIQLSQFVAKRLPCSNKTYFKKNWNLLVDHDSFQLMRIKDVALLVLQFNVVGEEFGKQ